MVEGGGGGNWEGLRRLRGLVRKGINGEGVRIGNERMEQIGRRNKIELEGKKKVRDGNCSNVINKT